MRPPNDRMSKKITASHERQNNNNKEDQENSANFRTVSMGDGPGLSNSSFYGRSSDSVSCWGDVPKRSTRLIDIISEMDYDNASDSRTSNCRGNQTHRNSERQQNMESRIAQDPDNTQQSIQDSSCSTEDNNSQNTSGHTRSPGSKGRERLLEWLRVSQAKRDENNRQIFSRWIDRLERLNKQGTTNVSPIQPVPFLPNELNNQMEYQHGTIFQQPVTNLPGLLAASTFLLGNQFSIQGTAPLPKLAVALQASLTPACFPNLLGGKVPLAGTHQCSTEIPSEDNSTEKIYCENSNQISVGSNMNEISQRSPFCAEATINKQIINENGEPDQQTHTTLPFQQSTYSQYLTDLGMNNLNPMTNGSYAQPYYIALPIVNDPAYCSQMFGYYCYPHQIITGPQMSSNLAAHLAVPRTHEVGQQLFYTMHPSVNQSQPFPSNQHFYTSEACTYTTNISESISSDLTDRRTDLPLSERSNPKQVSCNLPGHPESGYVVEKVKDNALIGAETDASVRCVEDEPEYVQKVDVISDDQPHSSFDFEGKWYSVLNDINPTTGSDQSNLSSIHSGLQFSSDNQLSATST